MYKRIPNTGNNVVEESCGPESRSSYFVNSSALSSYTGYTGPLQGYSVPSKSLASSPKGYTGPSGSSSSSSSSGYSGYSGYTGDSGDRNNRNKNIPGSIGVYSGCDELPFNNGRLYNVSKGYQVMNELEQNEDKIHFLSTMGLYNMQDYKVVDNPIGGKGYHYVQDGRVVDAARNIRMVLDQPAKVGAVDMNFVANFDNSNYLANYKTYSDIKNGQISYYVNKDVAQPFIYPVYTLSSYVDKTIRVDPMGSVKPEYIKTPVASTLHSVSKDQATRDELSFREDLMSRQQNLYNRTSWTNRWINSGM